MVEKRVPNDIFCVLPITANYKLHRHFAKSEASDKEEMLKGVMF